MINFPPRVIRARDAHKYLGMDRNRFNKEVRPQLSEVRFGKQCVAYDRLELDHWFEQLLEFHGRKGFISEVEVWEERRPPVSLKEKGLGTSTNTSVASVFAKAVKQVSLKKQKSI